MLFKTAIKTLFALSMAGTAMAEEAAPSAPGDGPALPIQYGKCYRIQTRDRQWMAKQTDNYHGWHFNLQNSDVYKVCQSGEDKTCDYDAVRSVANKEDFFLWDFKGTGYGANLLAANNPWGWFYASYGGYRNYIFHFQGTADCEMGTTPCGIHTGGHNGNWGKGIAGEDGPRPVTTRDNNSTVLLWFHEWECPEEEAKSP